jgi:hypothetical protein
MRDLVLNGVWITCDMLIVMKKQKRGAARAKKLSKNRKKDIAKNAANTRWNNLSTHSFVDVTMLRLALYS